MLTFLDRKKSPMKECLIIWTTFQVLLIVHISLLVFQQSQRNSPTAGFIISTYFILKSNWKLILSQTEMFNLFRLIQSYILLIQQLHQKNFFWHTKYSLWLNRPFLNLSLQNSNECLTINYRTTNKEDQLCLELKQKSRRATTLSQDWL